MGILTTILATLVVTLLALVLIVPAAWRSAKFVTRIVESVATFFYRLKYSLRATFNAFKRKPDTKEEAGEASERQQALLSSKRVIMGESRIGNYKMEKPRSVKMSSDTKKPFSKPRLGETKHEKF